MNKKVERMKKNVNYNYFYNNTYCKYSSNNY